jgi:hypothetical protein
MFTRDKKSRFCFDICVGFLIWCQKLRRHYAKFPAREALEKSSRAAMYVVFSLADVELCDADLLQKRESETALIC